MKLAHQCACSGATREEISSEAPANVYDLADQLVELAQALVGKVAEAKLTDRLREELGPRGTAGNCFGDDCGVECPRCGSGAAYRKGTRPRAVEGPRLGTAENLLQWHQIYRHDAKRGADGSPIRPQSDYGGVSQC